MCELLCAPICALNTVQPASLCSQAQPCRGSRLHMGSSELVTMLPVAYMVALTCIQVSPASISCAPVRCFQVLQTCLFPSSSHLILAKQSHLLFVSSSQAPPPGDLLDWIASLPAWSVFHLFQEDSLQTLCLRLRSVPFLPTLACGPRAQRVCSLAHLCIIIASFLSAAHRHL